MPSSEQNVQECDATDDDSSNLLGTKNKTPSRSKRDGVYYFKSLIILSQLLLQVSINSF